MFVYLSTFIAFLLFCGVVGSGIFFIVIRRMKLNFFEALLSSLFSGYIIAISIFSIIQTGFKTVNIFFVTLILYALWEILKMPKRQKITVTNIQLKYVFLVLGLCFFFFGFAFFSLYLPNSFLQFSYSHGDYILYAKIAKYISLTGEENGFCNLNVLDSYYNGVEPYHFFDLWGASLINYIFGINHYLSLRLIIYPFFYFLVFLGIICLFKKINYTRIVISFVVIWFGGFFLEFFQSLHLLNKLGLKNISTNLFNPNLYKLSYFYVFILCSYLLYRKKHFGLAILCFLGLSIANIITAPTIFISLTLIIFISFKIKIIEHKKLYTYGSLLFIFYILFIIFFIFYKNERAGIAGVEITSPFSLIINSISIENFKTQINILVGGVLAIFVLYFTIFFLNVLSHTNIAKKNVIILYLIVSVITSLSLWAVLFFELNSSQIFTNYSTSILNIYAIVLIISTIDKGILTIRTHSKSVWLINILIVFTILINITQTVRLAKTRNIKTHSNMYIKKIYDYIPENELVATIKSTSDMETMFSKYNAVYPLGDYLFLFDKNISSVNIGDLDTPIDSSSLMNHNRSYKAIRDGLFYRFSRKIENKNLSRKKLTLKFLEKFDIKYLLVSKDAEIPKFIIINTKSTLQDPLSDEKFLILKKPFIY